MVKYIIIFVVVQLILLIPSFFWYKKIIKKIRKKRINLSSIILTLIMPIIYTAVFALISITLINPIIRSKKFEQKEWIEDINSRYRMVKDLEDSNVLVGKNKDEIIKILGNDYKENCWAKNTICYLTPDPDNYAPLDHFEFIIYLDNKNKVIKVSYELI